MVSFTSSIMKNIVVVATEFWARFSVKLIYCINFESAWSACYLLKFIAIIL